jgi:hypothetical protein
MHPDNPHKAWPYKTARTERESLQEATRAKDERIAELEKALKDFYDAVTSRRGPCTHDNAGDEDICDGCLYEKEQRIAKTMPAARAALSNTSPPLQGATEEK